MNAQVDVLQMLETLLDRKAVSLDWMRARNDPGTFNRMFRVIVPSGAKITVIDGEEWVIKNNSQRERVVADKRAMAWFLVNVVSSDMVWDGAGLRAAARAERVSWTAVKRIALQMGWYLVPNPEFPGVSTEETLEFVGYEMDPDTRLIVCRLLKEAASTGIDLDSDLAWEVVNRSVVPGSLTVRDYDLCVEIVKSGFAPGGVEF